MPPDVYDRRGSLLRDQLLRFAVVGVVCTIVYLACFVGFAATMPAQVANAAALLLSALLNTAANRRLTFGVVGRAGAVQHHVQGIAVYGVGLAITAGSLAALGAAHPHPSATEQAVVLIAATAVATAARFVLLRSWVFAWPSDADAPGTRRA
ncbi:MAG: glycosyl transferase [Jatrophihabitantaceae bacterium]|nr:glycosyl transferase [Jatrophihabitantaceae bacterium]